MNEASLPYSGELARKALHLLAMLIPLCMLILDRPLGIAILVPLAVLSIAADFLRRSQPRFSDLIDRSLGFMMRPEERGHRPQRPLNGATWVMVTAALLLIVFPAEYAAPGMVIAMIADAAAALVGRPWGRIRWPGGSRTVEGTAAFLAAGFGASLAFPGIPLAHRLIALAVAAVVEVLPVRINDNLLLPFATSTVLWILAGTPPLW